MVLVPTETGLRALQPFPRLRALHYDLSRDPDEAERQARVMVVGLPKVAKATAFMRELPQLELVQTLNAGYDQWVGHLPAAVRLSNARGAHGRAVAEWVVAVLLAHYRRLGTFAAAQANGVWDYQVTDSLWDQRVGVLGAGDIGTHLTRMLDPFGARVTLVGRTRRDGVLDLAGFRAVLGEQDAVVLVLPSTPETTGLVDAAFLAGMRDGAVLVNAGRGPLVDTAALLAETGSGRVSAILDVTDPEPPPPDSPLWSAQGVTVTPHVSGSTVGLWDRAWRIAAEQIDRYSRGESPPNLVI